MTYTRAIGVVCGAIIDRIVRWLALSRIHPNVLTFLGLVINAVAALLFAFGWLLSYPLGIWPGVHPLDHPQPWPGRVALVTTGMLVPLRAWRQNRGWLRAACPAADA